MNEFKVGDVVRLRSGGPKMTVDTSQPGDINPNEIPTTWIERGTAKRGNFAPELLKLVDEED